MANRTKLYFLCPTWDYGPDGPIQLGNIVMSADTVAEPLNYSERTSPPTSSLFPLSVKSDVKYSVDRQRSGRYGVWTSFLSSLGVGVDMGMKHDSSSAVDFTFERVETTEFIPPDDYVKAVMAAPAVVNYIEKQRFRKSVFMVTAIKTVYGVTGMSKLKQAVSGEGKVTVDGTASGITPVSVGPELGVSKAGGEMHSFGSSSNFVFAFKLKKIELQKSGQILQKPETKGAMYDGETKSSERVVPYAVIGLSENGILLEEHDYNEQLDAFDEADGEDCVCVSLNEA